VLFSVLALATVAVVAIVINTSRPATQESSYYEVKRGDFLISIVEGGTIEAVNEVVIRNDVEGTARIIFIVPEGSTVKKGQLLVELDSSASQDAVNQQQINVEKSQFSLVQAQQQLDIQKSVVDSDIAAAKLKVEFAESDLKKFVEGEARQLLRNAEIEKTNVVENQQINEERLAWTEALFKDGYETKANLDKDRLAVSQSKLKLEQADKALWMVVTFDIPKKQRELEAAMQEAKENLDRVKLQGDRKLAQFQADVISQKSTLELNKTKLERDVKQLASTKIYAPQDGLVVYANSSGGGHFSSESMIEEGAVVRNRQELIKLPDVSEMKLLVKIHESHINQIQLGQPAYVVLDAMPDRRFQGVVNKVAPLPDTSSRWSNPNLKVYATEILITDKLPDVKPGVSARAEVIITNLENVLTVPIQAVTTRKGQQVVFLRGSPPQPVPVSVGMYNTKFIEITNGLKQGDLVLLSPPFESQDKDLGGSIIVNGEKVPTANGTNRPARSSAGPSEFNGRPSSDQSRSGAEISSNREGPDRDGMGPSETGAARGSGRGRSEGNAGGGGRFNREEMLKQFDANKDGQLDENERTVMRERMGRGGRQPGSSTNAAPNPVPPRSDATR
jgi:HlyD family secretion protein